MTITLRPYQSEMVANVHQAWNQGAQNVLLRADTGAGKTATLGSMVQAHQGASCIIAHRQELVGQLSITMARYGVRHNIIAAEKTRQAIAREHVEEFGQCWYDPGARCAIASVDTLIRAQGLDGWAKQVTFWVVDECFPAGTLVDGRPIETLRAGDMVTGFDEAAGRFASRRVNRVFKSPKPLLMTRIKTSTHHVVECTLGHPFWTKRGWVDAGQLTPNDVLYVRRAGTGDLSIAEIGPGVLQQGVRTLVLRHSLVPPNGRDESETRVQADDAKQPDAPRRRARTDDGDDSGYWSPTENPGRQWKAANTGRVPTNRNVGAAWVSGAGNCSDETKVTVAAPLQNRLRSSDDENCDRSGRQLAQYAGPSSVGPAKGRLFDWSRVASVEIFKCDDNDRADDGFVYNIEVDEFHTYVANGIVVHNCHHLVTNNKWHSAIEQFTHPAVRGLGPTATPRRADGKGLGRHADGVFDVMVHGPPMRWLINNGYLTDYRIICPPSDLTMIEEPGASGDWSTSQLRKAAERSHIVGDVVQHYQRHATGMLGATFCTDVETAGRMAMTYNMAGVPAALLTGTTPDSERRRILRDFAARKIMQLVTVDIVSEGFDLPALEVVSMARPTQSLALYMQQFGRSLRPSPGKGKALIIDHVSNTINHNGPPDRTRLWSLERTARKGVGSQDGLIPVRACTWCGQPFERFRKACPYCGAGIPEPAGRGSPLLVEGDLIELDADVLAMLRGEVAKVDEPIEDYAQRLTFNGAQPAWVGAHVKRHRARQEAQSWLRDQMAQWGGLYHAAGLIDAEIQRLFWHSFGTSVVEAMALGADEAMVLAETVRSRCTAAT